MENTWQIRDLICFLLNLEQLKENSKTCGGILTTIFHKVVERKHIFNFIQVSDFNVILFTTKQSTLERTICIRKRENASKSIQKSL